MKTKPYLSVLLFCAIFAITLMPVFAAVPTDISGHWAESYITRAVNDGIIKGYEDGTFKPDRAVSRAEFVSMVNRTLGNTGTATISFPDVQSNDWYYTDISKALSATYAAGYNDGRFLPDNPISREEAAVMISRFVPTYGSSSNLTKYKDSSSISDWASAAFSKVGGKGYLGPYNDGLLHPEDQLTRAQTAKILCEIKDKEGIITSDPVVKTDKTVLSNRIYSNNVTIHSNLGDGNATLDNCVVLGNLSVLGGGNNSVALQNSRIANASTDKAGSSVRILAKGETSVLNLTADETAVLETISLSGGNYGLGFNNVSLTSNAKTTLRGSFPKVSLNGSGASLTLESASVADLTVDSYAKNSTVTSDSKSSITTATVNAPCNFYGSGGISTMKVNSNGVTYETKPKNWTISSGIDTPTLQESPLSTVFSPANAASGVKLNENITISFSTAMTLYDGKTINDGDISDFITLRKDSASGTNISYSGSIDKAKKVITLNPTADFETNTKYYVSIPKNAMKDSRGIGNSSYLNYFNTEKNSSVSAFNPANGATGIPRNRSVTVTFPEAVVKYSNSSSSLSESYLKECISFRAGSGSGSVVSCTASINSARKIITFTPNSPLDVGTKYYVSIVANKLKTEDKGTLIPESSVTWTTAGAPSISEFSATAGDKFINLSAKPSDSGTIYAVILPASASAPSVDQIVKANASGQVASMNVSASGGSTANLKLSGLNTETGYNVYAVFKDSYNSFTPVSSKGVTTLPLDLSSMKLSVSNVNGFSFSPSVTSYNVTASSITSSVNVAVDPGTSGNVVITVNGEALSQKDVSLSDTSTVITVTLKEADGKTLRSYTVNVTKVSDPSPVPTPPAPSPTPPSDGNGSGQ